MRTINAKNFSLAFASALALTLLACGGTRADHGRAAGGPAAPAPPPAPSATAPSVQYDFYRPTTEAALERDTKYGYAIAKTRRGFKEALFEDEGFRVVGRLDANGFTYYRLYKESDVLKSLHQAMAFGGVISIEPEEMLYTCDGIEYDNPDPRTMSEQYSAFITQAKDAWTTYGFGGHRPVVVDLDSGVNFAHEDLRDVVTHAWSWFDTNGTSTLYASSTTTPTSDAQPIDRMLDASWTNTDGNGHGTHTAGTIAAVGNNGKGVAGVCWQADLISYKGMSDSGSGGQWEVYGSLWHLVQWKKANYPDGTIAVNMSLGGASANVFALDMVELCLRNNIVIVAAAGNEGRKLARYPAAYTGVIAVAATNGQDKRAIFSSHGRHVSVSAPGLGIISTGINGTDHYVSNTGTSMAAPFVTGLVTYMLTFAPDLRPDQIKTYLEENADFVDGRTGFDEEYGWGRVNVLKTIGAVVRDVEADAVPKSNYLDTSVKMKVGNVSGDMFIPFNGALVNLYQCDETGENISNYVAGSIVTSQSYADWEPGTPTDGMESGVVYFSLLRPGYYKATSFSSMYDVDQGADRRVMASTDVFEVVPDSEPGEIMLTSNETVLSIQMRPTSGATQADSRIRLYNSAGTNVYTIDDTGRGQPEIMQCIITPEMLTQDWWVGADAYHIIILAPGNGEYAMHASLTSSPRTGPAPNTYAQVTNTAPANGVCRGGQTTSRNASSQKMVLDVEYYGNLAAGITSVTMHYYKLFPQ